MTDDQVLHVIETRCKERFNATWNQQPEIILVYEKTAARTPPPPFVRLYVDCIGSNGEAYGGGRIDYSKVGLITAQIFTESGQGTTLARKIGAVFEEIFAGQSFGGIICRETILITVRGAERQNAQLVQMNSRTPFEYTHSINTEQ